MQVASVISTVHIVALISSFVYICLVKGKLWSWSGWRTLTESHLKKTKYHHFKSQTIMSLSSSIRRRLISSAIMSKNKKNSSNSNYDKLMTGVTREQGFKFTKKLTQLGKDRKYLDILHLAFGPVRSKILSNKQYENVKRVSKEMRNRPNSKIKPSFPKYAMVRPEVWNVVIQNLSKEGLMDESFSIFTKVFLNSFA